MKTRKTLLAALVLTTITGSVFATTTSLPENASDQYARTAYFGKGNTTEDTTLTERSTVIGSLNTIKRATDMTTIIGDSNSVDGKNNTVIGSTNIVQGHDSVVIGAGAQASASVVPDGDDAPLLTLGSAEGHGVTVIGTNSMANTEYASAIGYAAQSLGKNSIALGSYSAAGEMHAADSKYAGVSNNKGVLSIGAKDSGVSINYTNPTAKEPWANDFTRQIQHVSAGEVSATSTDAINGSQLQDAFDRSAANANNIATNAANIIKAKTSVTAGNGVTVNETVNSNGSTNYLVAVDTKVTDQIKANKDGIDGLNAKVADNTNAIKANTDGINGLNGKVGENTKAIDGLNGKVSENTNAIANNANGIKANADAIKANKDGIALNTVAINELADRVVNGTNALNNKINDVQKEGRRGVTSASALAALHPLDYNPDHKLDVMAGVGHYRGNNAVALGVAYRPNENLLFTVGTSINGKDTAINAGVSYKVGAKESTYMSPATMAKEIEELKAIIREMQAK